MVNNEDNPVSSIISYDNQEGSDYIDNNVEFITRILHDNNNENFGMEITVTTQSSKIKRIIVLDENRFDSLTGLMLNNNEACVVYTDSDREQIDKLHEAYLKYMNNTEYPNFNKEDYDEVLSNIEWSNLRKIGSLETILKNEYDTTTNQYPFEINATKIQGKDITDFSLVGHSHGGEFAEKSHAHTTTKYGIGSKEQYGHVRIFDNCNQETYVDGDVLSAHQGYVLNNKIENLKKDYSWSSVATITNDNCTLKYQVNTDLRLIHCHVKKSDFTGLKSKTGKHELIKASKSIPSTYSPSARVSSPLYRGDVVVYINTDCSVNVYNLTKIDKINLQAYFFWKY